MPKGIYPRKKRTEQQAIVSPIEQPQQSLLFNEYDFVNYGKFVPNVVDYGRALADGQERISEQARAYSIAQSRTFANNLPEVGAAMQRLADFAVGTALVPLFNGKDQVWATEIKTNYLDNVLNRLTTLGLASDWQTTWQLVLKLVLTDGDLLMIPYVDRYGLPNFEFIEGPLVTGRTQDKTVQSGRYTGYRCEDGVIYDNRKRVVAYQILGATESDDYTISANNCFLIFSPFSFSKGRGLPILASAARHGRNMLDYGHYIPQLVKAEAGIQLVETNTEGKSPVGRTAFNSIKNASGTGTSQNTIALSQFSPLGFGGGGIAPAVMEYFQGGYRYVKANGGKLESLKTTRPSSELQGYVTNTQKEMLCPLFPHQLLLSPETIGGPGSRGLKEILVASVNTHRAMIEKYARIALQYVLSVGMANNTLQSGFGFGTNYKENPLDWSFSKAPEISLDPGYERAADINDLNASLTSPSAIVSKEGKNYDQVLREIDTDARKKAEKIIAFQKDNPSLAAYAPQLYGLQKDPALTQQVSGSK